MKNILLVCSAGMSTSLLVTKMKEAAESQQFQVNIWSTGQDQAMSEIAKADLLLLGPQLQFVMGKFQQLAEENEIKVEGIDPVIYGRIDGEAVLKREMELLSYRSEER